MTPLIPITWNPPWRIAMLEVKRPYTPKPGDTLEVVFSKEGKAEVLLNGVQTHIFECVPDTTPQAQLEQRTEQRTEQEPVQYKCTVIDNQHPNGIPLEQWVKPPQRTWVGLTEEDLRTAFGKLYPSDIGILELAENNKDYAVEAIGARHHLTAFKAGARAGEAKLKEKNT